MYYTSHYILYPRAATWEKANHERLSYQQSTIKNPLIYSLLVYGAPELFRGNKSLEFCVYHKDKMAFTAADLQ